MRKDRIVEINSNGLIENGNIVVYEFAIKIKDGDDNNPLNIAISKIGGHIVLMNYNRQVVEEKISQEDIKMPKKTILISPWLDVRMDNPKIEQVKEQDKKLNKEALKILGIEVEE